MALMGGSKELLEQVRNQGLCTACGACAGLCPYHKYYNGKMAMIFDCDITEGRCFAFCPFTEVDVDALSQMLHKTSYQDSPIGERCQNNSQ